MSTQREEIVDAVRAAWPGHAPLVGRRSTVPAVRDGGNTAALIELAVHMTLAAVQGRSVEPTEPVRVHPLPGNVLLHVEDMGCEESVDLGERLDDVARETRTPTTNLDAAMLLTSDTGRVDPPPPGLPGVEAEPLHRPVLDLDMPVTLLPSSTEGHHHLLIDRPITWAKYVVVLDALASAGLVETGYVEASKRRGLTAVRVPWLRKGDVAPDLDGNRPGDEAPAAELDLDLDEVPA